MSLNDYKSKDLYYFSILVFLISCSSYDEVVEDYNSNFSSAEEETPIEQDAMIKASYALEYGRTFTIYAPTGYDSYQWSIDDIELPSSLVTTERCFAFYTKSLSLAPGSTYILRLSVTSSDGSSRQDYAKLYIFSSES